MVFHAEGEPKKKESVFRVMDVVSVNHLKEGHRPVEPMLSKTSLRVAKEMIRWKYQVGKGLGRELQGIEEPVEIPSKLDTFGLGFHPTAKERVEMKEKKLAEKEGRDTPMVIPPLKYTFPHSSGVVIT